MKICISVFRASFSRAVLAAAVLSLVPANPLFAQSTGSLANAPVSRNAAAAAPDAPFHGDVIEDIIARVNNQVISSSDYDRALGELEAQGKQRNWSPSELEDQKKQLLRDLVDNQLLLSKGKQLGITGETDTIRQLDDLRKQNNLDSMEALEKAAEQQGVSFADFKASIQNRVITSQVIREEVGRRINITGADEQAYYDAHKDQFATPEQVKLSEILIPTADPDNAAQVSEAQTKADAVTAQLKAGKNFADVAKASSGGPTAAQGGALGDFKHGQLADVLEKATFSLQPGQYTEPIRTKQGFVILKVDEHTPAGQQAFTAVQPQVEEAVGMEKMQPALRAYLTRLREEAYIDIKPGYLDAGSSRNEMRPVFSAYQPPQPKKKKKVDRTRFAGRGRTRGTVQVASRPAPALSPAVPAGVPSLADVPGGSGAGATASAAGTPAVGGNAPVDGAAAATPAANSAANPTAGPAQVASTKPKAGAQKPSRREKVRFGQAPRESLPAAAREQDGGAAPAGSTTEVASAAQPQAASNGTGSAPVNVRYANGESATEDQAVAGPKAKTRFSERAHVTRAAKEDKKRAAKADPYPTAPADAQEVADKRTQDQPLGLAGDTSKKQLKPKPASKTRYSDEAGRKGGTETAQPTQPAGATVPGADVGTGATAPATSPVTTQPYREPSPQAAPGTNAPVNTQTTPTGSGDPLGSPTPAPANPPR